MQNLMREARSEMWFDELRCAIEMVYVVNGVYSHCQALTLPSMEEDYYTQKHPQPPPKSTHDLRSFARRMYKRAQV